MITEGINGIHADLTYRVSQDWVDVLGPHRVVMIDEVAMNSIERQLHSSFVAAAFGALRWHPNFRPEVLVDGAGRLL